MKNKTKKRYPWKVTKRQKRRSRTQERIQLKLYKKRMQARQDRYEELESTCGGIKID